MYSYLSSKKKKNELDLIETEKEHAVLENARY
jgi:multidrug efflux pump